MKALICRDMGILSLAFASPWLLAARAFIPRGSGNAAHCHHHLQRWTSAPLSLRQSDDGTSQGAEDPPSAPRKSTRSRLLQRIKEIGQDPNKLQLKHGIYQIKSEEQHSAFLEENPDKLIIVKFKASYCRACALIEPKFLAIKNDPSLQDLPIVWAEITASPSNKDFFRNSAVLSLPTVHFYDGSNGLVENFSCGPAKLPVLRQKLVQFIARRVDLETQQLRAWQPHAASRRGDAPRTVRELRIGDELIDPEHLHYLRNDLTFFEDLTEAEFDDMFSKARLETFLPGDVIIRQGMPGKTFFVVKSGVVEMKIKSRFDDPIRTPPSYLGATVNQLVKHDFFGERALTTGEPYAASVSVVEKTLCFAFDVEDIPESSILSQQRRATQALVDRLTERYVLPEDYETPYLQTSLRSDHDQCILELLVRFKQIRQAAKCFDYVMSANPLLGNAGEIARRSMLVSKLSKTQQQDFIDVFNLADVSGTGTITLLEMRRFMESARKEVSDTELLEIMSKANPLPRENNGNQYGTGLTLNEYMGVMAEAEFYYLFTETFQELDQDKTGYVRAGDLDEVLNGVRDLISDDRKSIIDIEDQDVQVDYEQFAKMLLGAAL